MPTNDGGPAFPRQRYAYKDSDNYFNVEPGQAGMSLRDWFAGQALIAMVARTEFLKGNSDDARAEWAYRLADAMLKAREQT